MLLQRYQDFIIEAGQVQTDASHNHSFAVRVFDSPAGQGETEERVTIPSDLDQMCLSLARRDLDKGIELQIQLGMKLAGLLLPAYARELYQRSLDLVTARNEGLRLRLDLDDALTGYPWEFAYIQKSRGEHMDTDFLALDPRLSIVRHERLAQPVPGDWAQPPAKRRIVVAMASPEGDGWQKLPALLDEQRALKAVLDGVEGLHSEYLPRVWGDISLDEMDGTTVEGLAQALMSRTDVFHFSGHGEFAKEQGPKPDKFVGKGSIILATPDNKPVPFPAQELAKLLAGRGVRLAVLGACEGAQTGYRVESHIWGGAAVSLLREGIPAVVAMQYVVNDKLAAAFMGDFYRALVVGCLIDEAVSLGRAAIRREALGQNTPCMRDWGVPVLYSRARDGCLFQAVGDSKGRAEAKQYFTKGVRHAFGVLTEGSVTVGAMGSQSAPVVQKVREASRGLLIGGFFYDELTDMQEIIQQISRASGITVGRITGDADKALDVLGKARELAGRVAASHPQPAAGGAMPLPMQEESAPPGSAAPEASTCPRCGKPTAPGYNVCAYCGLKLQE